MDAHAWPLMRAIPTRGRVPTAKRLSFTLLATFVASSALPQCLSAQTPQATAPSAEVRARYAKREVRIPMRDGTTPFTATMTVFRSSARPSHLVLPVLP
jgi:hypothetical protein